MLDIDSEEAALAARFAALTLLEYVVLHWLAAGWSNADIAGALQRSEKSAEVYVSRVLTKLEAENRAQAVSKAYQHGFVQQGEFAATLLGCESKGRGRNG